MAAATHSTRGGVEAVSSGPVSRYRVEARVSTRTAIHAAASPLSRVNRNSRGVSAAQKIVTRPSAVVGSQKSRKRIGRAGWSA